mmetsp:Transcript_12464/g.37415  ORF Transcript_12464/g.37415 Transcript_12464/m.37415 type:complete len:216 (+) Transcript_12464:468-1115(+)
MRRGPGTRATERATHKPQPPGHPPVAPHGHAAAVVVERPAVGVPRRRLGVRRVRALSSDGKTTAPARGRSVLAVRHDAVGPSSEDVSAHAGAVEEGTSGATTPRQSMGRRRRGAKTFRGRGVAARVGRSAKRGARETPRGEEKAIEGARGDARIIRIGTSLNVRGRHPTRRSARDAPRSRRSARDAPRRRRSARDGLRRRRSVTTLRDAPRRLPT